MIKIFTKCYLTISSLKEIERAELNLSSDLIKIVLNETREKLIMYTELIQQQIKFTFCTKLV